jgi:hypothetical protein
MFEMTFLRKLGRSMLALGFACAVGGFTAAGCIDNSGNKTYPRGDAAADDTSADAPDDTGTTEDAPPSDAPAADASSVDAGADSSPADTSAADGAGADGHADTGSDTGTGG